MTSSDNAAAASGDRPVVNVVGAGMGGLSLGACLAKNGVKVMLFDPGRKPGGVVHTFRRSKYRFEASTHQIGGFGDIKYLSRVFDILDLYDVEMIRVPYLYEAIYLDDAGETEKRYRLSSNPDELVAQLGGWFPEESERIRQYFDTIRRIGKDILRLKRVQRERKKLPILYDALTALMLKKAKPGGLLHRIGKHSYRNMVEHYNSTYDALLEGMSDPLRSLVAQYWLYTGTPPSECPADLMAIITYVYLWGGPYMVKGGTNVLIRRLRKMIEDGGGKIHLHTPVERIVVEDGRARGIVTANNRYFPCDHVVSNVSTQRTFLELIGRRHLPADYVKQIEEVTLSRSAFQIYAGAALSFEDHGFDTDTMFFNHGYDPDEAFHASDHGPADRTPFMVTNYTGVDPGSAPEGGSSFVIIEFDVWDRWKDLTIAQYKKQKYATQELIVDKFEKATGIPLREKAKYLFSGTPKTFQRYSSATRGEIYGPAATIEQCFTRRTSSDTPIENLHLVGAYSQPAHGVSSVMDAGVILGHSLLKTFGL